MEDVAAKGVPVCVVAAKLPGEWIIRAIAGFRTTETLMSWIEPFVALVPDRERIEWTQHSYYLPHYLVYGGGDIVGMDWPEAGVYVFRHAGNDCYRDAEKLRGG